MRVRLLCVAGTLTLLAGGVQSVPVAAAQGTGSIRGHVRLTASASVNPPIRMGMDPACGAVNAGTRPTQEFVVRAADGGLANAFVRLKGSFAATPAPATPVEIDQSGCVYRPHVVGIQVGQALRVTNSDPTTHNVHSLSALGNAFNVSQPRGGESFQVVMGGEELMMRVTCDVHSWMNIYVGVVAHPYFAVSGVDGSFTIDAVPAGHHTIESWHERFGPMAAEVDVLAGQVAAIEVRYAGTETAAPPSR